jgi:hypothetical protein
MVALPLVALPASYVLATDYQSEFGTSIAGAAVGQAGLDRLSHAVGFNDRRGPCEDHQREEQQEDVVFDPRGQSHRALTARSPQWHAARLESRPSNRKSRSWKRTAAVGKEAVVKALQAYRLRYRHGCRRALARHCSNISRNPFPSGPNGITVVCLPQAPARPARQAMAREVLRETTEESYRLSEMRDPAV